MSGSDLFVDNWGNSWLILCRRSKVDLVLCASRICWMTHIKSQSAPLNFVVSCPTVLCQMHFPCWTAHSFLICSWVKLFCQDTKVWNSLSVELNCLELDRMLGEWNNRLLSLWSFWCFHKQCFPDYGSSWEMWGVDPWNEKQRADFPLGLSDKHEDQHGCLCWQTSIYYPAD